jgi:hypothetical protein
MNYLDKNGIDFALLLKYIKTFPNLVLKSN